VSARAGTGEDRLFLPELRGLDRGLSAPRTARIALLAEVEADLEELRRELMASGLPEAEARARAVQLLLPDGEAAELLARLHASPWERISRRISPARLQMAERTALVLTFLVSFVALLGMARGIDPLLHASRFLLPLAALGGLLVAAILMAVTQIWIRGDDAGATRWAGRVAGLSLLALGLGVLGAAVDLFLVAQAIEAAPGQLLEFSIVAMSRVAALLALAIGLALTGGVAWVILRQRIAIVDARYRRAVGLSGRDSLTSLEDA